MAEVRQLLNKGSDPNEILDELSFLHHAIRADDPELVNMLLQSGANPEAPKCQKIPPIHYAVEQKKNDCLKMFIQNEVNVNLQLQNGATPLFTAIAVDNNVAVAMLLEAGADPNIQSQVGDLPIFLAASRRNSSAVGMLLAAGSHTAVGSKSALIIAINKLDIESARLILIDHPDDELCQDSRGLTPLEIAVGIKDDPSFELLLLSSKKPQKSVGEEFVMGIKESILEDVDRQLAMLPKDPMTIDNLPELIDSIAVTEHTMWRFNDLIRLQREVVESKLAENRERAKTQTPLQKSLNQLRVMWDAKIKETEARQKSISTQVYTPESRAALKRWQQVLEERKAFFDDMIAKANQASGLGSNPQEEMEFFTKMSDVLDSLRGWEKAHIRPYQETVANFIKHIRNIFSPHANEPGIGEIFLALNALQQQIAETNSALFESRSSRSARSASRGHSRKSRK